MYPHPVLAKQFPRADVSNIIATALGHVFASIDGLALPASVLPTALTFPPMDEAPPEEEQAILTAMKSRWNEWLPLHLLPTEVFIEILLYVDRREDIVKRNVTLSLVCKYWRSVVAGYSDFWAQVRFKDKPRFIRAVIARGPNLGITVVCDPRHDDKPEPRIGVFIHFHNHHHNQPWMFNHGLHPNPAGMQNAFGLEDEPAMAPEPGLEEAAWLEDLDGMVPDPGPIELQGIDSRKSSFFNTTLGARVRSFKFNASLSPFRRQFIYKMSRKPTNELEIRAAGEIQGPHTGSPLKLARNCQAEHLVIRHTAISWKNTSFTRLRSLRLHGLREFPPSTAELRDVLISCPSLEWIVLQNVSDLDVESAVARHTQKVISPVTLPQLRSLLFMKSAPRLQSLFLHGLNAPKLTYVCSEFLAPEDFHSESFLQLLEGPLRAAVNAGDTMDVSYEEFYESLRIGLKHRRAGGWSPLTNVWEALHPGIELTAQISDIAAWLPLEQFISNQNGYLTSVSFETYLSHYANANPQPRWFFQDPIHLSFLRQWSSVTHLCLQDKLFAEVLLNYLSTSYNSNDGQLLVPLPHLSELGLFYEQDYNRISTCLAERSRTIPVAAISRIVCSRPPSADVKQMECFKNVKFEESRVAGRWASLSKNVADDMRYL